jgi:hypothetical protein
MRLKQTTKLFPLFALMIIVGAIFFMSIPVYAADASTMFTIKAEITPTIATTTSEEVTGGTNTGTVTTESAPFGATLTETAGNMLTVDDVRLVGDTLHITVTDKAIGETQTFEMKLSDYAKPSDEFVTVQATDSTGRISNSIKFKNPYYQASDKEPGMANISTNTDSTGTETNDTDPTNTNPNGNEANSSTPSGTTPSGTEPSDTSTSSSVPTDTTPSESAISDGTNSSSSDGTNPSTPDGSNPFTPDGTGNVMNNATNGDGKEFFTVETADGNVFYLIVDRQRDTDNVYLLNDVTENDLSSMAKSGDGKSVSAVGTPQPTDEPSTEPAVTPDSTTTEPTDPKKESGGSNAAMYVLVFVAVLAVGGIGYYVKIVKPKQNNVSDDYDDEPDDDDDNDFEDEEMDVDTRNDEGGEGE